MNMELNEEERSEAQSAEHSAIEQDKNGFDGRVSADSCIPSWINWSGRLRTHNKKARSVSMHFYANQKF